jgi:hypothetical protein
MLRDERVGKEKRLRLLTRLVIGLCVLLVVYIIARALIPVPAPGGMDGCLRFPSQAPQGVEGNIPQSVDGGMKDTYYYGIRVGVF